VRLGQGSFFRAGKRPRSTQVEAVLNAVEALSTRRRGGLVVFARNVGLKNIADTGTALDALLSSSLLRTIFEYDGPLHDGAVIVQGGRVMAAGCLLPLSDRQDIARSFGTRHRAALGMTEQSDAVVLVVSEETGALSLAYDARLYYNLSPALVQRRLSEQLDLSGVEAVLEEESLG
jgi:diadenylate cyclase